MFGRKQRAAQARRIEQLQAQNLVLVEGLRWYSSRANWMRKATNEPGQPRAWKKSLAAHDRGERARNALTAAATMLTTADYISTAEPVERLLDQVIGNVAGEPSEGAQVQPPALDPMSVRMEDVH